MRYEAEGGCGCIIFVVCFGIAIFITVPIIWHYVTVIKDFWF